MIRTLLRECKWFAWTAAALGFLSIGQALIPGAYSAEVQTTSLPRNLAFQPGEKLTYDVSWSNIVTAGTAVMEVRPETTPEGRNVLRLIVSSRTVGLVAKFYTLGDLVQSVFDPQIMQSLSYSLKASHGKRKKHLELVFDHARRTVVSTLNNESPETLAIPDQVQDALSALYYLRTREDLAVGKTFTFEVFESGKSWPVEVRTLGREKVKTAAGKFNAIKVGASKGLFMNEGEILIWLTDDSRKVPVLIKSTISIGSLMFTLTDMKIGD